MGKFVIYIPGLFEAKESPLFRNIQKPASRKGFDCKIVDPFKNNIFGLNSFSEEIKRIEKIVQKTQPKLIVAHSLGAYSALQLKVTCQLLLLDPSLPIKEIVYPNLRKKLNTWTYNDGHKEVILSESFVNSLKKTPSIKSVANQAKSRDVHIVGAGKGGSKVAENYHHYIPQSNYTLLPQSDHNFSSKEDRLKLASIIKSKFMPTFSIKSNKKAPR
jgi:predicted esterase YcpF (UPF0227 family)